MMFTYIHILWLFSVIHGGCLWITSVYNGSMCSKQCDFSIVVIMYMYSELGGHLTPSL